jgi:uncharacterized protein (DUF736 family)
MNYDNTNTGVLFTNKKSMDNHPDVKGKININGVEYELAGWTKQSDKIGKFLSLKVSPMTKPEEQPTNQTKTSTGIPF